MKAGDGNRTHVACLEGRYSTIELHPRFRRRPSRRPEELVAGHKGRSSFMSQVSSTMVRISSGLRPPSQSFILSQFCGNYHRSEPGRVIESHPIPSGSTWVEQDSNLRRHCHQIYSLAPLAAWVSTRSRAILTSSRPGGAHRLHQQPSEQSWRRDSNSQPSVYKTDALPIELRQQPGP